MIDDMGRAALAIFGGIVTIAIVSVIVGRNSVAPQAIQATGGALAQIVQAAVSPQGTNAANPVSNNQAIQSPVNTQLHGQH